MTISGVSNSVLSSPAATVGGGTTANSIGGALLAAVAQATAGDGSSSNPLLQEIVSLSTDSAIANSLSSSQTYNAQGLLNTLKSSASSDPLLQSLDGNASGSFTDLASTLLDNMVLPTQGGAGNATSANAASGSTSTPTGTLTGTGLNSAWTQILQQDPALAGVVLTDQMNQNIIDLLA